MCLRGAPLDVLLELPSGWLTAADAAPMRGDVCLVSRRHAVELHDLTEAEGAAFMRDVQRVSRALSQVCQPVKLNYEVHGNSRGHPASLHVFVMG